MVSRRAIILGTITVFVSKAKSLSARLLAHGAEEKT